MLLMIDNYDSFTYNLVQYFFELGQKVEVFRNDQISLQEIEKKFSIQDQKNVLIVKLKKFLQMSKYQI